MAPSVYEPIVQPKTTLRVTRPSLDITVHTNIEKN